LEEKQNIPSKEIIALSDFEFVQIRPAIYIGSLDIIPEKVRIIKNNTIEDATKEISTGFYKLMNEVLDNAFDEAKRMNGKMEKITISFDSQTKRVTVTDTGNGFHKGTEINDKTGLNNIETALTILRAGSNFKNEELDETILGTHGIGASVVNMLSDEFEIHTINDKHNYKQVWKQFKTVVKEEKKKKSTDQKGTIISFIPRVDKFKKCQWDFDYIEAQMIFKDYIRKNDPILSKVKFEVYCDGKLLNLNKPFIPYESFTIDTKIGRFILWEHREDGTKMTSFINTALCNGIHQTIMQDVLNELFDYKGAHAYYDFFFMLNLPPKHVRFGDQNKTQYKVSRWEIEPILEKHFFKELKKDFTKTEMFKRIKQRIKEKNEIEEMSGLKKAIRNKGKKAISEKYIPPTDRKDSLFICEGLSAAGSLALKRNPLNDGIYALKGKVKNTRSIGDLSKNAEIVDLINILGLEIGKTKCDYSKIIISCDADPDGHHIATLIINFFFKWFRFIIEQEKLFILITPLVSVEVNKKRKYFYALKDFVEYQKTTSEKFSNIRYLKGLGSLAAQDWEIIMNKRDCFKVTNDKQAEKYLEIAFGKSAGLRKNWMEGKQ